MAPKKKAKIRGPYKHYGTYDEAFTGHNISISTSFFERLAEKIGAWIDDLAINGIAKNSSFTIEEFYMESKIPEITLRGWREKSPILAAAYKHAILCLGVLREKAALYGKINPILFARVQHAFSPTWLSALKIHEEMKKPVTVIQTQAQIQEAGIERAKSFVGPVPTTGTVPRRT